ncbi:MAG: protein-glutamate O-methyltransferase CheR, partial [Gammaproteobacteria bacterium]|nr:protein-glutamate O-methyltransferase CheR [Gammaproteobacteria bacterium]
MGRTRRATGSGDCLGVPGHAGSQGTVQCRLGDRPMTDEPALAAITDRLAALAAEQGLDLEALGAATVRSAIRGRLRATHCDGAAYLQRIARDTDETGALLEDLLVPETWFFRDPPAFDLLRSAALAHGLTNGASTPFRVLSLACSTGEEVWSIAIALHEAGLLPRQMRVDALDLSRTAVARAQTAIYGSRSFRGPALVEKERYFVDLDNGRSEVNPALRASVRIATGNLLETRWERDYDAIFCRNVLIYMTYEAREQTISRASAALVPGGLLFVGHADAPSAAAAG